MTSASPAVRIAASSGDASPPEGSRRVIARQERVFYCGYWIKTYPLPADSLRAKKNLIEALTRRLFNHTEHGLNVPGVRLADARAAYEAETDPPARRVKGGMLAGALFNRATDIFRHLVELQSDGVEILPDYPLVQECGRCLMEALELGRLVLHRSGEEGIDELWGEPFRAYSLPLEAFYEGRYIKIGQCMRDIDRIAVSMVENFAGVPDFAGIGPLAMDFAAAARVKCETLRTDREIFEVWTRFVTAGERLSTFAREAAGQHQLPAGASRHNPTDGIRLIDAGRSLIVDIVRARTPMPKSTREYIDRICRYRENGRMPQ